MEVEVDFGEFSKRFNDNFNIDTINLKELCITKSVIKPADYFKSLKKMMAEEAAHTTPNKKLGTVEDYETLYKTLDKYPSNLQRPMHNKKRELQRANSVTLRGTDQDQNTCGNNTSNSLSLSNTRMDDERPVAEIYRDFKKFQQKLSKVHEEANALQQTQSTYIGLVGQLQSFAQQLEKLMPCEREAPDAFTANEEANLMSIAENLKQLNYMRANSLSNVTNPLELTNARLETLVDVLNYALMQIRCYINV